MEDTIQPLVYLRDVRRSFYLGEAVVEALSGISLDIHANEFLAVWGPSGSGKSTLMHILGLIDAPSTGEVWFEGQNIHSMDDDTLTDFRSQRIGFVFQSFNLVPVLSALENVMLPLQLGGVSRRESQERATLALAEMGMERFLASRPDRLWRPAPAGCYCQIFGG